MTEIEMMKEIESWIGTPWKHGVALKGWGVDCIQFIVEVAKTFDWIPQNYMTIKYNQDWALHNRCSILEEELEKTAKHVEIDVIDWDFLDSTFQFGDILTFRFGKCASHAGIYIGKGIMIHAYIDHMVTRAWVKKYRNRFCSAWRVKAHG